MITVTQMCVAQNNDINISSQLFYPSHNCRVVHSDQKGKTLPFSWSTMNLPADHPFQANNLIKINNLIGKAGKPVNPFIWKQPLAVWSQKIQVEDQRIDLAGNPVGNWVKWSIYPPVYGIKQRHTEPILICTQTCIWLLPIHEEHAVLQSEEVLWAVC